MKHIIPVFIVTVDSVPPYVFQITNWQEQWSATARRSPRTTSALPSAHAMAARRLSCWRSNQFATLGGMGRAAPALVAYNCRK